MNPELPTNFVFGCYEARLFPVHNIWGVFSVDPDTEQQYYIGRFSIDGSEFVGEITNVDLNLCLQDLAWLQLWIQETFIAKTGLMPVNRN